ncbi:AIR synthase related protein [Eubacterium sp. 1001713B170207_170306_E7]|uniref:AIR synthase related protein n=1 Tax=Eubacterium sp. 1001713B170207_170306_E7 TaxID=2787097 RepID=UPI0018978EA5|nr:AIR synthase related protein [Eubacterium sp. 1001713B170207_170306_E7]
MRVEKIRDCTLIYKDTKEAIVITCDSIGAIGDKAMDVVRVPPELTAYETVKVALGELLALGAAPIAISDGLAVETDPTGKRMINGIKKAIAELPDYEIALTGSCEDNMPTVQTGAGITVIGLVREDQVKYRITKPGDKAVLFGKPLYGDDFSKQLHLALQLPDFTAIRKISGLLEMVPVGSKGIAYEVLKIAEDNGLSFEWKDCLPFDIGQSGGPASCCVATVPADMVSQLENYTGKQVAELGCFVKTNLR